MKYLLIALASLYHLSALATPTTASPALPQIREEILDTCFGFPANPPALGWVWQGAYVHRGLLVRYHQTSRVRIHVINSRGEITAERDFGRRTVQGPTSITSPTGYSGISYVTEARLQAMNAEVQAQYEAFRSSFNNVLCP